MDRIMNNKFLNYISAFLLLFGLGLFNYYDQHILAKTFLYQSNYHIYFICKILIQYVFPILSILTCIRIDNQDSGNNLIIPSSLICGMLLMISSIFILKDSIAYYWLTSYSIVSVFCLNNILKKRIKILDS